MAHVSGDLAGYSILFDPEPLNGARIPLSPVASPHIQAIAQAQDQIGWDNLLLGQLAVAWSTLQHVHLTSIASWHTATHILLISYTLWTYCNRVAHDRTLDGLAHANKLQVAEELHTQFDLDL